jgi:hypothetical protein
VNTAFRRNDASLYAIKIATLYMHCTSDTAGVLKPCDTMTPIKSNYTHTYTPAIIKAVYINN